MKDLEIYEIVKELEFYIGLESLPKVHGKILKIIKPELDDPFLWKTSHYYKHSKNAGGVYRPSTTSGNSSIEDAKRHMISYVMSFKEIGIEENESY